MSVKDFLSKDFLPHRRVEPAHVEPAHEPSPAVKVLQRQLDLLEARVAEVTKSICEQMYAASLEEALAVADKTRNEPHVMELRDERAELAFLNIRKTTLAQRLAELK